MLGNRSTVTGGEDFWSKHRDTTCNPGRFVIILLFAFKIEQFTTCFSVVSQVKTSTLAWHTGWNALQIHRIYLTWPARVPKWNVNNQAAKPSYVKLTTVMPFILTVVLLQQLASREKADEYLRLQVCNLTHSLCKFPIWIVFQEPISVQLWWKQETTAASCP